MCANTKIYFWVQNFHVLLDSLKFSMLYSCEPVQDCSIFSLEINSFYSNPELSLNKCFCVAGLQKSTGGVAYDYILKPAADNAPKISSPPKDKPLTHDEIFEKLQKAEARRQVYSQY